LKATRKPRGGALRVGVLELRGVAIRSHGGSNARENRIAVCAWHHLRGIHGGLVRARGTAPGAIYSELGLRGGQPPLLHLVGDTHVSGETYDDVSAEEYASGEPRVTETGALVAQGTEAAA